MSAVWSAFPPVCEPGMALNHTFEDDLAPCTFFDPLCCASLVSVCSMLNCAFMLACPLACFQLHSIVAMRGRFDLHARC